jgi:hypothetical protein
VKEIKGVSDETAEEEVRMKDTSNRKKKNQ